MRILTALAAALALTHSAFAADQAQELYYTHLLGPGQTQFQVMDFPKPENGGCNFTYTEDGKDTVAYHVTADSTPLAIDESTVWVVHCNQETGGTNLEMVSTNGDLSYGIDIEIPLRGQAIITSVHIPEANMDKVSVVENDGACVAFVSHRLKMDDVESELFRHTAKPSDGFFPIFRQGGLGHPQFSLSCYEGELVLGFMSTMWDEFDLTIKTRNEIDAENNP